MDAPEILRLSLPEDGENPQPADKEAEAEKARAILDFCEAGGSEITHAALEQFAPTTPWIAWQLAIIAEAFLRERNGALSVKVASAAFIAAEMAHSVQFTYRNLLTLGNVLAELGYRDDALTAYRALLRLPFAGGVSARAGAHLALGSIYGLDPRNLRDSIYHYEHAMRFVGPRNDEAALLRFWHSIGPLYKDAKDMVGLALYACQTKFPNARELMREIVEGSLERKMALWSRLMRQGNREMADLVKSM